MGRQVAVAELGEEGLEVAGHGQVQGGLLWPARLVSRLAQLWGGLHGTLGSKAQTSAREGLMLQ